MPFAERHGQPGLELCCKQSKAAWESNPAIMLQAGQWRLAMGAGYLLLIEAFRQLSEWGVRPLEMLVQENDSGVSS